MRLSGVACEFPVAGGHEPVDQVQPCFPGISCVGLGLDLDQPLVHRLVGLKLPVRVRSAERCYPLEPVSDLALDRQLPQEADKFKQAVGAPCCPREPARYELDQLLCVHPWERFAAEFAVQSFRDAVEVREQVADGEVDERVAVAVGVVGAAVEFDVVEDVADDGWPDVAGGVGKLWGFGADCGEVAEECAEEVGVGDQGGEVFEQEGAVSAVGVRRCG